MSTFNELLGKLTSFRVLHWGNSSEEPSPHEREEADLEKSQVTSSLLKERAESFEVLLVNRRITDEYEAAKRAYSGDPDPFFSLAPSAPLEDNGERHIVVLDIDHPAHLIDSSTPGKHHLIVEIPPVDRHRYFKFLQACSDVGLVEYGWVDASGKRGHSDIRLPWVKKGDSLPQENIDEYDRKVYPEWFNEDGTRKSLAERLDTPDPF